MKNIRVCAFVCFGILAVWQLAALSQAPNAPQIAFDIPKTDIDNPLKNAPPAVDQQLRVVDMGKYNLGVGIIHRARLAAQSGAPWVNAFILYPWGDPRKTAGDGAEFVAVDKDGNIYGGEPNPKRLQK